MQRSTSALNGFFLAMATAAFGLILSTPAPAQGVSFSDGLSGSLSDPLTVSNSSSGFNSSFDASTSSIANPDVRVDVSDATHSQLLGSTLSPADPSYANPYVETAPRTGIQTDAQAAVGFNDFSFGGRKSQAFATGGFQRFGGATEISRRALPGSSGSSSLGAAFSGGVNAQAAFSGNTQSGRGTESEFSGEGVESPSIETGSGAIPSLATNGASGLSASFFAADPVLAGSRSGWETGPELHGDLPSPSTQTASFFAPPAASASVYEFDDGQTPLDGRPATPGQVLGTVSNAKPPATGFPDSTRGLAGLPGEAEGDSSPFNRGLTVAATPFPPVSEGTVYDPKPQLEPNLHAKVLEGPKGSFDAYEQRLREFRMAHGMSISQAATARQQDLRAFQRSRGHQTGRSTLEPLGQSSGGMQGELMGRPVVR